MLPGIGIPIAQSALDGRSWPRGRQRGLFRGNRSPALKQMVSETRLALLHYAPSLARVWKRPWNPRPCASAWGLFGWRNPQSCDRGHTTARRGTINMVGLGEFSPRAEALCGRRHREGACPRPHLTIAPDFTRLRCGFSRAV